MNSFPHLSLKNDSATRLSPHIADMIFGPARKWVKSVGGDSFLPVSGVKIKGIRDFKIRFSERSEVRLYHLIKSTLLERNPF